MGAPVSQDVPAASEFDSMIACMRPVLKLIAVSKMFAPRLSPYWARWIVILLILSVRLDVGIMSTLRFGWLDIQSRRGLAWTSAFRPITTPSITLSRDSSSSFQWADLLRAGRRESRFDHP